MWFLTHDQVEFSIPGEWLQRSGAEGFRPQEAHFTSAAAAEICDITSIKSPRRAEGVRWFDETRMVSVLSGIVTGASMPPINVHRRPGGQVFELRDGFHRYYASIALGLAEVPVNELPFFEFETPTSR